MSVSEVIALLEDLTPEERLQVAAAAAQRAEVATPLPQADQSGKEQRLEAARQRLREIGPMDDATYAAYMKAVALTSQIDEELWR